MEENEAEYEAENEADVTELEQKIWQLKEEDVNMGNIIKEKTWNESNNFALI